MLTGSLRWNRLHLSMVCCDSCSSIQLCNTFGFFSVSAALVLCVRLCAILNSVTFLIQRDLHRAASENLWLNPVLAAPARFSQVSEVEGRAASVRIDALA